MQNEPSWGDLPLALNRLWAECVLPDQKPQPGLCHPKCPKGLHYDSWYLFIAQTVLIISEMGDP